MAELPTSEELEELYHSKGCNALVWYAWRNALRVLPALGALPFESIWPDKLVHNLYSVCQVPLLLSKHNSVHSSMHEYVDAFSNVASSNMAVAFRGMRTDNQVIRNAVRSNVAAYVTAKMSTIDVKSTVRNAMISAKSASVVVGLDVVISSVADYKRLCCCDFLDDCFLDRYSLWESNDISIEYQQWKKSFFLQLEYMKLGALAENLKFLSGDGGSKAFSVLASEKISSSITSSPILLTQVMEGEELEENHAIRVIFLGNGGAGKTSLVNALMNNDGWDSGELEWSSFHRHLDVKKNFPHLNLSGDQKLDLFLWDFSGQTISYGLHAAFINENCVYVIVVDSRHEQVLDDWLCQIRHTVGTQAKVIIVTDWFENCEVLQNQKYLLRKYPDLLEDRSFFYFSLDAILNDDCSEPFVLAFDEFVKTLWSFSLESQRFALKKVLDVHGKINNEFKGVLFIRKSKLLSFIEYHDSSLNANDIVSQLEKLGFILRVTKDCRDYCLMPNWLMEYSYRLFYLDDLIAKNGVLSWDKLVLAAQKDGFDEDLLIFLVDFLQDQGVCKKLCFNNQDFYFLTYSCNPNEHESVSQILRYRNDRKLIICFDLPYFPLGIHAHLVSALFRQDADFGVTHFDKI